ncbi:MAG: putative porin [Bacteroidales bacterium]|nr:putative porin [Bacteroidales bacterium]
MKKELILVFLLASILMNSLANNPVDTSGIKIMAWKIQNYNLETYFINIDTTLDNFHIYNPVYRNSPFNTFLGNIGNANISNVYYERINNQDFIFLTPFKKYMLYSDSRAYFNTTNPYTHLMYTTAIGSKEQKEENISVFHTQNVNSDLNIGFSYDRISSNGVYVNQKALTSKCGIFSSYTNHNYFFYVNANINSVKYNDNGGIADIARFTNDSIDEDPGTFATRLSNASIVLKNKNASLVHGLTFSLFKTEKMVDTVLVTETKLQGTLVHSFTIDQSYKNFHDELASEYASEDTTEDWKYYSPLRPINELETFDSVYLRTIHNYIQYQMEPGKNAWLKSGLRVGIGNELQKYAICSLDTSGMVEGYSDDQVNTYLSSELYNTSGLNWNWSIYGKYYFTGYKINNTQLTARLGKHLKFLNDTGFVSIGWVNKTTRPNYYANYYYSNHLRWKNDFANINETNLLASISIDSRDLLFEVQYSLIDNYIYYQLTDSIMPSQSTEPLNVLAVSLGKGFTFWKFYSYNRIVYQAVSNASVLSLPDLSIYNSTYFHQTIVKDVLDARLGFDITYNTAYYANAFMASHGVFYQQNDRKFGNYPYVDVYVTAKLKRTKFVLKYSHANEGLLSREYFTAKNYPMNYARLVFGISWMFYD